MTMTQGEIEKLQEQAAELQAQIATAKREKVKAEREERFAKATAERDAHYARMYEEIGLPLAGLSAKQHAAVYAYAWEQGHSSGYEEVEMHYGELAELVLKILDAK